MATGHLFVEVQRFRQWWVFVIIAWFIGLSGWAFIQQIVLGVPWGNNPAPDSVVIALTVLLEVLAPAFLLSINLRTEVRTDGVYVRLWPLHLGWVRIPATSITGCEAQRYRPLRDYGGWGIRWGAKGKAYNISGDRGVMLTYGKGQRLLIGSQRPEELERAINSIRERQTRA